MKWAWISALVGVTATAALARSGGIAASGCQGCHGGAAHTVAIDAAPATLGPGDTTTVTVTARGPGVNGGVYLTASRGSFALIAGQGTRLLNGDVVHAASKPTANGQVSFQARWTAPATPGGAELFAFTVLGNGDGRSGGDASGEASRQLVFGCTGTTFFRDFDGDGVGSRANGTALDCAAPQGFAAVDGDCDDFDAAAFPGAPERCNGRDDDCDGQVDEGLANVPTWPDADGDGYGDRNGARATGCATSGRASNDGDCDDRDPRVHPGAMEVCNQRDDNCDGRVDENVRARCGTGWCAAVGLTCDPMSCQPGRPLVERCNLLDDDCDGLVDEGVLCPSGQACVRGGCVVTDVEALVDPADAGPGVPGTTPTPPPTSAPSSCATASGVGLPLFWWRRRSRSLARPSERPRRGATPGALDPRRRRVADPQGQVAEGRRPFSAAARR